MDNLPNEIKDQIIQLSDDKSRRQLRAVNTFWFNLVRYDQFQIYYATPKVFPTIVETLSQYQWPIGLTLLRTINLTSTHVEDQIFKLTQLTGFGSPNISYTDEDDINPNWTNLITLTNLQSLDLSGTPIPVHMVYFYSNLTSLYGVNVPNCASDLTKELFINCTKLQHLDVASLSLLIAKPPRWHYLQQLTYLHVEDTKITLNVKKLTNLRELTTYFTRGVKIGNITTLETLCVEHPIEGEIFGNKNLTELTMNLQDNTIYVTSLSSLSRLRMLTLTFTHYPKLDNNELLLSIPQHLTGLSLLVKGKFSIKRITHLTNLRMLDLCSHEQKKYHIKAKYFKHFLHLTRFYTGKQYAVVKYLPKLREFSAWNYSLTDGSTIYDFDPTYVTNLEHLSISKSIPSEVFNRLTVLRSLKALTIYEKPNDTFDYDVLTYMDLEDLQMNPTKLARADCLALRKLTKLYSLKISSSKEVTKHITLLASLTQLHKLHVHYAQLEHLLPFTFLKRLSCRPEVTISQQLLEDNFPYLYEHNFQIVN